VLTKFARHRYALVLIGAAASWGIATVIAKSALAEIPPVVLLPVQLTASALLVTPVLLARGHIEPSTGRIGRLIGLGILNPGISYALGLLGLLYISASEAVLLWAVEPLMIMALAAITLGERVSKTQVVAAAVAAMGVFLVVSTADWTSRIIGVALTLAAVAACAIYTVLSRKWTVAESSLRVVAIQQGAALVFAVALAAVVAASSLSITLAGISLAAWGAAVASGCLYYGIAFWLYLTGLKGTPASVAGQYLNLIPIFGIAAGSALLGEQLIGRQWIGAAIVMLAVAAAAGSGAASTRRQAELVAPSRAHSDQTTTEVP
jgi:drug/metabolite transporter (DMT)-like permease